MRTGKKAEALIIAFEGWDVPWIWPGQSSGITLPIGYDIGYEPFDRDWAGLIDVPTYAHLREAQGITGRRAQALAPSFRGVHIPHDAAIDVFRRVTLPRYELLTTQTFPNSDKMPMDAFGALVSLIFNRGGDLNEKPGRKSRAEMREIRTTLMESDPTDSETLRRVASLVRVQARYWIDNPKSDGDLHDRREDEAALIESCIS